MKVTIFAVASMNGYIATDNGDEDFLSDDNWEIFKKTSMEYKNIIWGRKTYEAVLDWDEKYIRDLDGTKIIVISKSNYKATRSNVHFCKTPQDALDFLEANGIDNALISGGTSLYTYFLNNGLANDIILNYNSVIIPSGKMLFDKNVNQIQLDLADVKKITEDILQVRYLIKK